MSSDAIVLAGAAALAVGALHKGWFVDRWEDLNDKYEMEEKARIWRLRAWRHTLTEPQRDRFRQDLGPDLRIIRPARYNRDFEQAMFRSGGASRALHERELVWAQAPGDSTGWRMATALFFTPGAGAGQDGALVVISTQLASQLGLTEGVGGPVRAHLRPPSASSSRPGLAATNADRVERFRFAVGEWELAAGAVVRDLAALGGAHNTFIGLPPAVKRQLEGLGARVAPFGGHHAR